MALISLMMISCGGNGAKDQTKGLDISGQWELMDIMDTKSVQIGNETIEIYMEFKADKTFSLWQKLGEGRHRKHTGSWELSGDKLTGKYSDGKAWGSEYEVSLTDGNLYMAETKTGTQIYVYKKCTLPSGLE